MGAGISNKQFKSMVYGRLRTFRNRLRKAGIDTSYHNYEILGKEEENKFSIYYGTLQRASNGEAFSELIVNTENKELEKRISDLIGKY